MTWQQITATKRYFYAKKNNLSLAMTEHRKKITSVNNHIEFNTACM